MRFSSYNMEGRIKSKTKFINEGVMIVMIEIILILLLANFALSCWNKVEKIIS